MLAGNVSIYFSGIPPAIQHVKAGQADGAGRRAAASGVVAARTCRRWRRARSPRLDLTAWFGFFVPKGTPDDIVDAAATRRLRQILDSPEMQARLVDTGVEPGSMSAAQFEHFVASERTKYGRFISELAIQASSNETVAARNRNADAVAAADVLGLPGPSRLRRDRVRSRLRCASPAPRARRRADGGLARVLQPSPLRSHRRLSAAAAHPVGPGRGQDCRSSTSTAPPGIAADHRAPDRRRRRVRPRSRSRARATRRASTSIARAAANGERARPHPGGARARAHRCRRRQRLDGDVRPKSIISQPHLRSYGFRLEADGQSFVYSGDTGPCRALAALAQDCDVLVHMCHYLTGTALSRRRTRRSRWDTCELARARRRTRA